MMRRSAEIPEGAVGVREMSDLFPVDRGDRGAHSSLPYPPIGPTRGCHSFVLRDFHPFWSGPWRSEQGSPMPEQTHIPMIAYSKSPILFAALAGSMFFAACSNSAEEQNDKMNSKMEKVNDKIQNMDADAKATFEKDRQAVASDLRSLRDNIDRKLKDTNDKLAQSDLKASERTEKQQLKTELEKEQATVNDELDKVNNATASTWDEVKADADKVSTDVKTWWSGVKDDVDRKTDSDNDNDGH
jgi:hypothetical protein